MSFFLRLLRHTRKGFEPDVSASFVAPSFCRIHR